jgi:phosphatidate cytidylyltransferase
MKSLTKRLLLTFTSIPALFSLIYFLPQRHHFAFFILVLLSVFAGTYEIRNLAFIKNEKPLIPFWAAVLLPLAQYVQIALIPAIQLPEITLFLLMIWAFASEVIRGESDHFEKTLHRISHTSFLIIYPGFFSIFLVKILALPESGFLLLMLFLLVFSNDIFAYVFGMLLGKNNRNIFAVSPNKSIAGFIGGVVMTIVLSITWVSIIPSLNNMFSIWQSIILGLIVAIASDTGDLIESAFKRGAGVKDSGNLIFGRGGLMDSIDSLVASAPFFFLFISSIIIA